jgi:hypothetical protein
VKGSCTVIEIPGGGDRANVTCGKDPEGLNVRFGPIADKRGRGWFVRFVPIAANAPQQTACLFDHLVGAGEQRRRHVEAKRTKTPGNLPGVSNLFANVIDQTGRLRLEEMIIHTNQDSTLGRLDGDGNWDGIEGHVS